MALLAVLSGLGLAAFHHPFYVSVAEINHNPQAGSLEITVKVFTDDLERALEARSGGKRLFLGERQEAPETLPLLGAYLSEVFRIASDGQPRPWNWVGKETELEVTWIYLEIPDVGAPRHLQVENRLLTEYIDTQKNIVHARSGGELQSLLLDRNTPAGELVFGSN
ncbi:MAG: DUF6702 family protein [Bacteroidia bacterium]|nr:DUF6702 family protein [Bacteroidia bacterium]